MDNYLLDTIITREMIEQGYKQGIVQLVDYDGDTLCNIGEYEFCFDYEADGVTKEEYLKNHLYNEVIDNIHLGLTNMEDCFEDEYLYYYWYLKENLKSEQIGV